MNQSEWATEFPTEPGYYYFYGFLFKGCGYEPKLQIVEVTEIRDMMYISNGEVLHNLKCAATGRKSTLQLCPNLSYDLSNLFKKN